MESGTGWKRTAIADDAARVCAMQLIYVDESGNTGGNLTDPNQPLFVLGALIVPEDCWLGLEFDLEQAIADVFPGVAERGTEIHASDLRNGSGDFHGVSPTARIKLRDRWMHIATKHQLKLVYRAILKKRYGVWHSATFVPGIQVNPHVAAFALIARVVDDYLTGNGVRGMFISDENKEIVGDVEKSIKVLRGSTGSIRLRSIIEKGFFIDSAKSRALQLCDVCVLSLRKREERLLGLGTPRTIDDSGIALVEPLIHRGNEASADVLKWLADGAGGPQKTKGAARD
jgi:hypothetical protein